MKKAKETETRTGLGVKPPKEECSDKHCPFHGCLPVRGRAFKGEVISSAMRRSVTVEWPRIEYVRKYERYLKKRSRVKAHNPDCIGAKKGDYVLVAECKPISKTKSFVVVQKTEK